ncbi:aldo/keto reductase [Pseudoruegeria sp. HB172150]|uniref:aldo/keto reductase n=1 Tax=Pseudoruegeria sp. HB172150 TaxID=2721164 RepID=UPI0020A65F05|nr:aldo/keto reductase [Pseudoruegeria sp. HB172150]
MMDYVRFGSTGMQVSRLCFGSMSFGKPTELRPWTLGLDDARTMFRAAWDGGINFFDTANVYSEGTSEEITGQVLWDIAPRDEIVLATKVCSPMKPGPNGRGLSRKAILHEIDQSLKRLGTDYVDLYQIHRADPLTPFEETMDALNEVVRAGKARYIGASSMYAWQFLKYQQAAERIGGAKFVSMQDQVNLIYREEEREMLPLCRHDGIAVMPWSPLASGRLARPWGEETERTRTDKRMVGTYGDSRTVDRTVVEVVQTVAEARGVPMAQVAMAWVLQVPGVTAPIIGVSRPGHVTDARASLDLTLTPEEIALLEAPYRPRPVSGF